MESGYRDDARCEELADPSLVQFFVSWFVFPYCKGGEYGD